MDEELERHQWPVQAERDKFSGNEKMIPDILCVKSCTLVNYLIEYPKEADLKWSLFCAACNSYRFDSVLKPFPPFFLIDEENKQIERLREVVEQCLSFPQMIELLKRNQVSGTLIDLLYWALIDQSEPTYRFIPKEKHQSILSKVPSAVSAPMPDYIFKVMYRSKHQQKFAITALNYSTILAFHGSRLDNFYSIVNYGLQASFNKRGAFGSGTYLSSERGISISYSPAGFSWNFSIFGSYISIVALCEIIDHPDVKSEFGTRKSSKTNMLHTHENSSPRGKYFIVENNDLVRVSYLLIYNSGDTESSALMTSPTLLGWIKRHKMFTFATAYIILLLAIGSSNSSVIYKFIKRIIRY